MNRLTAAFEDARAASRSPHATNRTLILNTQIPIEEIPHRGISEEKKIEGNKFSTNGENMASSKTFELTGGALR